ncbi:unnamed protein product [Hermetia illucens]|uniref:lysozyme n=1 Tax=Hermetia illucens TaxID=343691 RepID=A0A7R8YXN4_HERIL|nr:invertebrate-type lysozyme 3-like isoform X2 [Hermetia illucens]CAD7089618.1 unnamed protein product [Hermetia illucens]
MFVKVALICVLAVLAINRCQADVSHVVPSDQPPVTEVCLGCICEAISGCNTTEKCNGDTCGLFRITWAYWSDAGKPTQNGEDPSSQTAYPNCVNEPYCAARAVQNYMARFGQDCNGDGVINCYDHAAIHKLGGYGCKGDLTVNYYTKLNTCLQKFQG